MTQSPQNIPQKTKTRVIKKYPNRRLYDSTNSRYITLGDIRQLVVDQADFVVVDKNTKEDITRAILLQVIAEQEHGTPVMSQDFLSQLIRNDGGAMQHFMGSYLEHGLKLFAQQSQAQPATGALANSLPDPLSDPIAAWSSLTQKNLEFWQTMQQQFFSAMAQAAVQPDQPIVASDSNMID